MLFCDAQGVFENGTFYLTDPCILSNTDNGRVYGSTDLGKYYLFNWFRGHKCNKYCNSNSKKWLVPNDEELNSVPIDIRTCSEKSTMYRLKDSTVIGATKCESNNNNDYSQYNRFGVREKIGEKILFAGKVDRSRWNKWETSMLLVTNHGNLSIVNTKSKKFQLIKFEDISRNKLSVIKKYKEQCLFVSTTKTEMIFRCKDDTSATQWVENINSVFQNSN